MKTIVDQLIVINGQKFYSHGCLFEDQCPAYNPALILYKPYPHLNKCTVGGGTGCKGWRFFTHQKMKREEPEKPKWGGYQ